MSKPPQKTGRRRRTGVATEFWLFLKHNKKWWMTPIVLVFLLLMGVVFLSATGVAPIMYTLF